MVTLWSEIPMDILRSVFERLSFVDFHRAKIVCSNWYSCSKQTLPRKTTSPWVILFPEEDGNCALYNPEEARVYKTKRNFSGTRFLANSGRWFLVLDSRSNLYIIDVFSEKKIDLPPLESIKGDKYNLKRVGDKKFKEVGTVYTSCVIQNAKDLRGLLWVDEKKEVYVVVWYFSYKNTIDYLAFCKNGEDHYHDIPIHFGIVDMVLRCGDSVYVLTTGDYIRKLDLSGQESKSDILSRVHMQCPLGYFKFTYDEKCRNNIAVTVSGEVLFIMSIFSESTRSRIFLLYKKVPPAPGKIIYNKLVKVDSLGDEALLLDLGITVPADGDLGIEPNSIYFTRHDRIRYRKRSCPDICVFNLATKTLKRFPDFSNFGISTFAPRIFCVEVSKEFRETKKSMETTNSGRWSEIPIDILRSVFERLSFVDFHRAKIVCSNWCSCSKQSLLRKTGSPWLILFLNDGGCAMYNPDEARIYRTKRGFSGIRFLANSGNWFLVLDSKSNLYIIDVFSEKKIDLPPLESMKGGLFSLEQVGDTAFKARLNNGSAYSIHNAEDLRGLLWVDEKKKEFVVVWFFDKGTEYLAFCKNGEDHYRDIPIRKNVGKELQGLYDMVLYGGDSLYISTTRQSIRKLKFFGQEGFIDVSNSEILPFRKISFYLPDGARFSNNIAVTTSGEVLLVQNFFYEATRYRSFRLYRKILIQT
ncbi:F-box-like domain superfamily [Arabidopsis suecica]|uniref:F-box-like domain superfamily n=1 Tax=Arabidopsis suecica TaxID=45249 RepID=A0A8T1ZBT3_ARASU|nr:F-box-like domain superfamily [Arabidopsis suecica]